VHKPSHGEDFIANALHKQTVLTLNSSVSLMHPSLILRSGRSAWKGSSYIRCVIDLTFTRDIVQAHIL
jgi:hypothetical protein